MGLLFYCYMYFQHLIWKYLTFNASPQISIKIFVKNSLKRCRLQGYFSPHFVFLAPSQMQTIYPNINVPRHGCIRKRKTLYSPKFAHLKMSKWKGQTFSCIQSSLFNMYLIKFFLLPVWLMTMCIFSFFF